MEQLFQRIMAEQCKNLNWNPIKMKREQDPGLPHSLNVVTNRLLCKYPTALRYKVTAITVLYADLSATSVWEAYSKQINWVHLCCLFCKSLQTLAVQMLSSVILAELHGLSTNSPFGVKRKGCGKSVSTLQTQALQLGGFFTVLNSVMYILH